MFKCLRVDFFRNILFFLVPLVRPGFSGRAEGETIIFFCGGKGRPPPSDRPAPSARNARFAQSQGWSSRESSRAGRGGGGSAAAPGARLPPPLGAPPRERALDAPIPAASGAGCCSAQATEAKG